MADLTHAGTYYVTAHYAGDENHTPSDGSPVAVVIAKATATINVMPYNTTYDGTAHMATGTATGAGGIDLGGGLNLNATTHTNAGAYPGEAWTFHDPGGNYEEASGTVNNSIAKANAVIVVIPYHVVYDGTAHTATGVIDATLRAGLALGGTTHTDAVTYSNNSWTFHDAAGNYNDAAGTVNNSIAKADQTITFGPLGSATFGGDSVRLASASGSGLPLNFGIVSGPGSIAGDNLQWFGAGSIVVRASQAGNANYNAAIAVQRTLVVNKAVASIMVTPYNTTYDGTARTATGVGGVNLGSGLVLGATTHTNAGSYAGDTWTFHDPGGNYEDAVGTVNNRIARADQAITFGPLRPVTLGVGPLALMASSSSGLPVTFRVISGPGSIHGTSLTASGAGGIVVQADQAGDNNYNPASFAQQTLVVEKASPTAPVVIAFRVLYGNGLSYDLTGNSRTILPWRITGVEVVFSENVFGTSNSLIHSGIPLRVAGFRGNGSNTLRWTFAGAVESANVTAQLVATGVNRVRDVAGGALDGDGNGVGGDAYSRNFKVLYGDFDGNGHVSVSESVSIRNLIGSRDVFADLNGDRRINLIDVRIALRRRNALLR